MRNIKKLVSGFRHNMLEIIEPLDKFNIRGVRLYLCKCDCGNIIECASNAFYGKNMSCGCYRNKTLSNISKARYKGGEYVSGTFFHKVRKSARVRGLQFDITIEYLEYIYEIQNGKCALSGVELGLEPNSNITIASVDRIDSSIGYIEGNIQWVHKIVNKMKTDLDEEVFVKWCLEIAQNVHSSKV